MSYRQLRTLTREQLNWQRALAGWRVHNIAASLELPPKAARRMVISADNGAWRAIIDPREWLCHELPNVAALAGAACDDEKIMALFNTRSRPLTFAHSALKYRVLRAESFIDGGCGHAVPMPRLSARECTLWVTDIGDSLVMPPPQRRGLPGRNPFGGGVDHRLKPVALRLGKIVRWRCPAD
ncbi:hypothetical protein ABK905_03190 [Acerihabitans sp. KWT182]|uniref:SpaO N-terminal domain-containing protein n=1 Tax=Acerihabitans sp. KWT182 TaxID=3157919 RepID=A0AAU7QBR3_9GAMM